MTSSCQVSYDCLFVYLQAVYPDPHVKRSSNLAWIVFGMVPFAYGAPVADPEYISSEAMARSGCHRQ
jgi:hypothetical protein